MPGIYLVLFSMFYKNETDSSAVGSTIYEVGNIHEQFWQQCSIFSKKIILVIKLLLILCQAI